MQDKFLQFLGMAKRANNLLEGYNKCEDQIKHGNKVSLCILSCEVSDNTKDKFERMCERKNIPLIQCYTNTILGKTLGREEISVISIIDSNMSNKLIDLYNSAKNKRG